MGVRGSKISCEVVAGIHREVALLCDRGYRAAEGEGNCRTASAGRSNWNFTGMGYEG